MSDRPRDSQRSRLYGAENPLLQLSKKTLVFNTLAEAQAYADALLASAWWKRRYRARAVEIAPGKGHRRATASYHPFRYPRPGWVIQLPRWARNRYTLVHELAHVALDSTYPDRAGHGREYASILLQLTRHCLGETPYRELRFQFVAAGVRHRFPSSTPRAPMSPEQRQIAAQRLQAARTERGRATPDVETA